MSTSLSSPAAPTVDYDVPFFGNTPDDEHCSQATLRSVRKFFEPHLDFTWDQLDIATGKQIVTWRMAGMLWLRSAGYQVHDIETLDYAAFAKRGMDYWIERVGPEAAAWEEKYCDIPLERARAIEFIKVADIERRIPTQKDIQDFLKNGFLVQVTVNAKRLNGQSGYLGHAILVKGYDQEYFITHDPGLPPHPGRLIHRQQFEEAWANDTPNAKVMTAMRLS